MATFRTQANFVPMVRSRKNGGQFVNCEPGKAYFMTEGIDYRKNESTGEGVIKLNSLRSSLSGHAKKLSQKLNKKISVKIDIGMDQDTNKEMLKFEFFEKSAQVAENQPTQELVEG